MTTPLVTAVSSHVLLPASAPEIEPDLMAPDAPAPDALARELAHEQAMCNRGRDRYFNSCNRLQDRHAEANATYGKGLVRRGIEPLRAAIAAFMVRSFEGGAAGRRHKAANMLQGMDYTVVAFITLRKLMDVFTMTPTYQRVAVHLGREVELEQKLTALQEDDAPRYRLTKSYIAHSRSRKYRRCVLNYAFSKSTTVDFEPWPDSECLHLGSKLIELACEATNLFRLVLVTGKRTTAKTTAKRPMYKLEATEEAREWVEKHQEYTAGLTPDYWPTLIPPKPWTGAGSGGYWLDDMPRLSLVKTTNVDYLKALDARIEAGEMQDILKAVNALQDTPWSINKTVLEVANTIWQKTNAAQKTSLQGCTGCWRPTSSPACNRVNHWPHRS